MRRILVAVDGSERSAHAVRHALELARFRGTAIDALYLIGDEESAEASLGDDNLQAMSERAGERLLREAENWAKAAEVPYQAFIERGDAAAQILHHSDMRDITVLGALGAGASEGSGVGGVAKAVANEAIRPVLFTRGGGRPIRTVLVAYNRTGGAASALTFAGEMGVRAGWRVVVVHGTDSIAEGEPIVAQAAQFLANYGVEAETRLVIPNDGANAVFDTDNEIKPDLILTGSRGRGGVARALMGSVSQQVLEQALCSVMIFH